MAEGQTTGDVHFDEGKQSHQQPGRTMFDGHGSEGPAFNVFQIAAGGPMATLTIGTEVHLGNVGLGVPLAARMNLSLGNRGFLQADPDVNMSKLTIDLPASKNPRARTQGLIVRKLDDEVLVYDRDVDRAICLNAFAAEVWERCDGRTSPSVMAGGLAKSRSDTVEERAIWLALDQLSRSGLLEEDLSIPPSVLKGTSRRELLRAIGIGAAAAVPAVTSIMVPRAADAQSCFPDGAGCVNDNQCCNFNCNGGQCGPQLLQDRIY